MGENFPKTTNHQGCACSEAVKCPEDFKPSSIHDESFAQYLFHLDIFRASNGHANVPKSFVLECGYPLGMHTQRFRRAKKDEGGSMLNQEREKALNAREFYWEGTHLKPASFEVFLEHLDAFIEEYSHARVPKNYRSQDGYALGVHVQSYRRAKKAQGTTKLTLERELELDNRKFVWRVNKKRELG